MLTGSYSYGLVALSWLIAVLASYTAIEITRLVAQRHGKPAIGWGIAGSLALGTGIWTMHFIGMLAFSMRMPYTYDWIITGASLAIAIAASAVVIAYTSRKAHKPLAIVVSGVGLGAGIGAMHYTGMAAMQIDGRVTYEPFIVAASIGVGVMAATAAVSIIHSIVHADAKGPSSIGSKAAAAMIMGLAICGMHYTAMAAARYEANPGAILLDAPASNTSLSIIVALAALLLLGVTQLTVFFGLRITAEQRRIREAQRRALHLNELLDCSGNEILVVDLESLKIVNANRRCCANLGYSLAELSTMSAVDIVDHATERSFRAQIGAAVDSGEERFYFESSRVRADGTVYPVQVDLQFSTLDGVPYLLLFATDITARRTLQRQLDIAREYASLGRLTAGVAQEIRRPAAEITDNLRFLRAAMGEALDLIDALSGVHLAASKGELTSARVQEVGDMLKTVDPCYLADEIPLALDRSLDSVSRISSILRALKDFAHPGNGRLELTDINRSVQNAIIITSSEWKYVAALDTDLDPDLPLVPCKPWEISQAILILIVNAAQAIERRLRANPDAPSRIEVSTRVRGHAAEIAVRDSGAGIPSNIGRRVFETGFATESSEPARVQGLAIAYGSVVEGHGGSIDFTSVEGEGTTFTIRLPVDALHGTAGGAAYAVA